MRDTCVQQGYLLCWYSLHAGGRGAWPRVELVDEQTGKLVLGHKGKSLLKVLHRRERESGSEGGREGGVEEGKECPNVCVRVHVCLCIPYLWCFSGEATDNICCYGDTRDTAVERVCTCIRANTTTGVCFGTSCSNMSQHQLVPKWACLLVA